MPGVCVVDQFGVFPEHLPSLKNRTRKCLRRPERIAPASDENDLGSNLLHGNGGRWNMRGKSCQAVLEQSAIGNEAVSVLLHPGGIGGNESKGLVLPCPRGTLRPGDAVMPRSDIAPNDGGRTDRNNHFDAVVMGSYKQSCFCALRCS